MATPKFPFIPPSVHHWKEWKFGPDVTETHGVVKPRRGKTNTQDWLVVYKPL